MNDGTPLQERATLIRAQASGLDVRSIRDQLLVIPAPRDDAAVPMHEGPSMTTAARVVNAIVPRLAAAVLTALCMSVTAAWWVLLVRGAIWVLSY